MLSHCFVSITVFHPPADEFQVKMHRFSQNSENYCKNIVPYFNYVITQSPTLNQFKKYT